LPPFFLFFRLPSFPHLFQELKRSLISRTPFPGFPPSFSLYPIPPSHCQPLLLFIQVIFSLFFTFSLIYVPLFGPLLFLLDFLFLVPKPFSPWVIEIFCIRPTLCPLLPFQMFFSPFFEASFYQMFSPLPLNKTVPSPDVFFSLFSGFAKY